MLRAAGLHPISSWHFGKKKQPHFWPSVVLVFYVKPRSLLPLRNMHLLLSFVSAVSEGTKWGQGVSTWLKREKIKHYNESSLQSF